MKNIGYIRSLHVTVRRNLVFDLLGYPHHQPHRPPPPEEYVEFLIQYLTEIFKSGQGFEQGDEDCDSLCNVLI